MLDPYSFVILILLLVLFLGMGTFIAGVVIMIRTAYNDELKTMAQQTAKLVQKGLAEDVAGLVGNASNLLDSMGKLVQNRQGVGIMLSVLGMVLMAGAITVAYLIYRMSL